MQQTQPAPTFAGTKEERRLAEEIFGLARFQGRFFAATAPIRLTREDLVGYLASQGPYKGRDAAELATVIDATLKHNRGIFARVETDDGVVTYATTKGGTAPVEVVEDQAHTLAARFMTPVEAPPPPPKREAPRIAEAWSHRLPIEDLPEEFETGELTLSAEPAADSRLDALAPVAEAEAAAAEAPPAVREDVVEAIAAAPAVPPVVEAPAAEVSAIERIPVEQLRAALAERLESDDRFVQFGDHYYAEEFVDRYSRGDLRRIREYILEEQEPLSDNQLLQNLFSRRPNDPSYESARFSINYRLSREKREFDFVGTRDVRLWQTGGLAPIGTTLRKASELGQDFRILQDEPAEAVGQSATHVLTFYEWVYGLLPLDGATRDLFPAPYLEDQKTATLRFEVPQLYATFLAELRYPTGNRGGYLAGFDEFYRENLAPGAIFTIERTAENDGQFTLRFKATPAREERVLQIDERRNRYVFRPQQLVTEMDDDWTLTEARYPRLANVKPLDDKERRRPEAVVGAAFERVAENVGTKAAPRYWSAPEELLPIVNLERPFTLRALRDVLESPQYAQFSPDADTPGAFFYEPPAKAAKEPAASKRRAAVLDEDEEL